MGCFSDTFARLLGNYDNAKQFADLARVGRSTISRFLSGKMRPDTESLAKILQVLPENDAAALLEAYLLDEVPRGYTDLVAIEPRSPRLREQPEEYDSYFHRLRPQSRDTIKEMSRLFLLDQEIAETMRRLLRKISPEWAAAQDGEIDRAISKSAK